MSQYNYQEIIECWFDPNNKPLWFNSTPVFDVELKDRFESVYIAGCQSQLSDWEDEPEGILALIILFDQLPLNMYRGDARSFEMEQRAQELASLAVEKEFDLVLNKEQKMFIYMPFMHSEKLVDQDRALALYEKAGLDENLKFAKHHRDIIARFNRFPHRNAILNRESTEAEKNYLVSGEAFLG